MPQHFFVITGGPGSGKSTLLEAIGRRGFLTPPEAGRGVIQHQVAIGGHALPWDDRQLFADLMLSWDMRSYHIAEQSSGPVFFDRGVPDVLGYLRLCGLPVPDHVRNAATTFRYNRTVFIAPPWKEIFRQDHERKQDFDEAVRTYEALAQTYSEQDYDLVEIPRVTVEERVELVLENVTRILRK